MGSKCTRRRSGFSISVVQPCSGMDTNAESGVAMKHTPVDIN